MSDVTLLDEGPSREGGSGTVRSMISQLTALLEGGPGENPREEAEWILVDVLGVTRAQLNLRGGLELNHGEAEQAWVLAARRVRGIPLQLVLGSWDFYGLRLAMRDGVFIPRPETEVLVEKVLELGGKSAGLRVLDLGTGTGAIPLAIKSQRPGWTMVACDKNLKAVELARRNAGDLGLEVTILHHDFTVPFAATDPFDIVVSNPPYIPQDQLETLDAQVAEYDPHTALFGGTDGLEAIRLVIRRSGELLPAGGHLLMEMAIDQGPAITELLEMSGFETLRIVKDLAGLPRVIHGRRR